MDEERDLADGLDCPNLLCEEEENWDNGGNNHSENSMEGAKEKKKEEDKLERAKADEEMLKSGLKAGEEEASTADNENEERAVSIEEENKDANSSEVKDERRKSGERRVKKQSERLRNKRGQKDASERPKEKKDQVQEVPEINSDEDLALSKLPKEMLDNGNLSNPIYLSSGVGQNCPPAPIDPLYCTQSQLQPSLPQLNGTKRLHSPQPSPQPVEMEITQVYCTRRSVRYSTRGKGQTLDFPLLPGLDMVDPVDPCLLPPPTKKKTRTLYSTEQLEHLEGLFLDDHYPDADKRKLIAASVGVTPQRIMVWFQNRRAKWRKMERSSKGKVDNRSNRTTCSSPSQLYTIPSIPTLAPITSKATGTLLGNFAPIAPLPPPAASSLSTHSIQTLPSYGNHLTSPSQPTALDGGQHQSFSQGGLSAYHPLPMRSPPPLRRATLPLFTTAYNNPTLPPLNTTTARNFPLLLETLESSSSLTFCDAPGSDQPSLQDEASSLLDYEDKVDYLTSGQQTNSLSYHLQNSYPPNQIQPSLPHLAYLTPSPYLAPNPPDSNHTSYLTFGPGGGSNGVVTYETGSHAYFQTQTNGHLLLQAPGHHGGVAAYQSYPWGNMYSEPAMLQNANCPPTYSCSLGATGDQLPPSTTTTLPLPPYLTWGSHDPSHASMQYTSNTQTHSTTSTTTVLPLVSTLLPSLLQAESSPFKISPLPPSQNSPIAPESLPAPSCVKIECDSPQEFQSHFYCDFSPMHF